MGDEKTNMGPLSKNSKFEIRNSKLLILHGWSYSVEKWKPFLKLLAKGGIECELFKIPGLTAPLTHVWTLDDYVSWLHRTTKNEERITILGHSNGGRIASAFTSKYPEKVSRLILIDSAGIIRRDFKTLLKKAIFSTAAKIGKKVTNRDSIRNLYYRMISERDYNNADPILKKTMLNLISEDLETVFFEIKAPTLILWGENDTITPLSDGKRIHALIKNSNFEVIENTNHSPQFTHPKKTSEIVIDFLNH